jgi:Fur family transcriptional regulator, ferric uptake regulator
LSKWLARVAIAGQRIYNSSMARPARVLTNLPRRRVQREAKPFEPVCAVFRRHLHEAGLKFTPERAMILDSALRTEGLFSADDLADALRDAGHRASRATVYRTLTHLHDAGILKQVFFDNKQSYFEVIVGGTSNDYLICAETGKVIEFNSTKLKQLRDEICREHGFDPISHQMVIYGLSPDSPTR